MPTYHKICREVLFRDAGGVSHRFKCGTIISSDDYDIGAELGEGQTIADLQAVEEAAAAPGLPAAYSVRAQGIPLEESTQEAFEAQAARPFGL